MKRANVMLLTVHHKGQLTGYSKTPYKRTSNFKGQAAIGSYLMVTNPNIRLNITFLNRFLIYEALDVHDNLHFYC